MPDYKVDFHTHSVSSHDGGITIEQYQKILDKNILDYVAITDHNKIDLALEAHKKLGERIIVGEEIKSKDGEIIGLFLKERIEPGSSAEETVSQIREQDGTVYIPHPVNVRGVSLLNKKIISMKDSWDIIEIFNAKNIFGRFNNNPETMKGQLNIPGAVGSDSHSFAEIGRTYNILNGKVDRESIVDLLKNAKYEISYIKPWHIINPKLNKFRKLLNG